jgi:hypothetical protein
MCVSLNIIADIGHCWTMNETLCNVNVTDLMVSAIIEHIAILQYSIWNYKCVQCRWKLYLCMRALVCTGPHTEVSVSCSMSSAGVKTSESRGGREEGRCGVLHIQYESRAGKVTDILCRERVTWTWRGHAGYWWSSMLQVRVGNSCDPWQSLLPGSGRGTLAATQGLGSLLPQSPSGDGTKNCSGEPPPFSLSLSRNLHIYCH